MSFLSAIIAVVGNPLISTEFDRAVAQILLSVFESSSLSLRALSRESGVKLTRLGDVLRRGKAMTIGEINAISSALGLVGWQVMREAEESVELTAGPALEVVDGGAGEADLENGRPDSDLLDMSQLAARKVSSRPGWDASKAGEDAGEDNQDEKSSE